MTIDVWKPRFVIPKALREATASLMIPDPWFRKDVTVDMVRVAGIRCLLSDGFCDWHDDLHIDQQWSLIFVLRNDRGSYAMSRGAKVVRDQPAGTAILLDIHHEHKLGHRSGKNCLPGVWCGMCLDLKKPPKTRRDCEALIRAEFVSKNLTKEKISA